MDGWDWALLAVASYVATVALVRMMLSYRDKLMTDFRDQIQTARGRPGHPAPTDRAAK